MTRVNMEGHFTFRRCLGVLLRLALKVILKCLITTNHTFFHVDPPLKLRLDLIF